MKVYIVFDAEGIIHVFSKEKDAKQSTLGYRDRWIEEYEVI